jgi:hypothetical protein
MRKPRRVVELWEEKGIDWRMLCGHAYKWADDARHQRRPGGGPPPRAAPFPRGGLGWRETSGALTTTLSPSIVSSLEMIGGGHACDFEIKA